MKIKILSAKIVYKLFKNFFFFCLILLFLEGFLYVAAVLNRSSYLLISKRENINASVQRILCLGDSFTYGLGADRGYSYPAQLEKLLNYNNPKKKFKVFYYGINGLSSSIVANTLSDNINKYRPNILIILSGCNDHWNVHQSNLSEILKGKGINDILLKTKIFLYKFRTFRLIQLVFNEVAGRIRDIKKDKPGTIGFSNIADEDLYRELIEYNYKKIIQTVYSSEPNIKLFFQTYPTGPARVNKFIKAIALNYKIPMIEQDVIFSKLKEIEPFVACDGWHLNAKGYNLMAKNIYQEFLREGVIDKNLTRDIEIREKEERNEIFGLAKNIWEYDLKKIAQHPEKIIAQREDGWYFWQNSTVDLPEIPLMPGEYVLQIQAKGTPVDDVYPLVGFYYKSEGISAELKRNEINKVYVNGDWGNYFSKKIIIGNKQNVTFYISFENDDMKIKAGRVSDRNLYINKIILIDVRQAPGLGIEGSRRVLSN